MKIVLTAVILAQLALIVHVDCRFAAMQNETAELRQEIQRVENLTTPESITKRTIEWVLR